MTDDFNPSTATRIADALERLADSADSADAIAAILAGPAALRATGMQHGSSIVLPFPPDAEEGWIEWPGGDCPVRDGTIVDVKHRDGKVYRAQYAWRDGYPSSATETVNAGHAFWHYHGMGGDIIAYKVSR